MNKSNETISILTTLLICGSISANTANLDESTKILLKLTNAKSAQELVTSRTQKMHEVMQYFDTYTKCETTFTKLNYFYNNKEEFVKNPELAKNSWNNFIDNKLSNQVNEKLSTLTKSNLKNRTKECTQKEEDINIKVNEFDVNLRKKDPNFKGLKLQFNKKRINKRQKVTPTKLEVGKPINVPVLKRATPQPLKQ